MHVDLCARVVGFVSMWLCLLDNGSAWDRICIWWVICKVWTFENLRCSCEEKRKRLCAHVAYVQALDYKEKNDSHDTDNTPENSGICMRGPATQNHCRNV